MAVLGLDSPGSILEILRISNNEYEGISYVEKFGENPSVDAGSAEDIWDVGGPYIFLDAAEGYNITAGAGDSATGVGARTIKIEGLNSAYEEISETVTLIGASAIATSNSYLRMSHLEVLTAGASAVNIGNVVATSNTTSVVSGRITARFNHTLMAVFTVPADKTGYIFDYYGSIGRTGNVSLDVQIRVRPQGQVFSPRNIFGLNATGTSHQTHVFTIPLMVEEKSDVVLTALASGVGIEVFGGFDMLMRNNF